MKNKTFLLFMISLSLLSAKIIDIKFMHEIKPYLKQNSVIVFDLDNTIMEPIQELGSDQWFDYYFNECIKKGLSKNEALQKCLKEWFAIQSFSEMKLVEPETKQIIDSIQERKIVAMGMTTRDLSICICTLDQLESLKINLEKTAPSKKECYQNKEGGILYKKGVLFTSGTHKGRALFSILEELDFKPKSIIFINDKRSNIEPVQEECKQKGIHFIGLRYGFLDEKVAIFNKKIANLQHEKFGKIINNEEAKKLLKN